MADDRETYVMRSPCIAAAVCGHSCAHTYERVVSRSTRDLNDDDNDESDSAELEEKHSALPPLDSTTDDAVLTRDCDCDGVDDEFGWRMQYDARRNIAFEFHTYTGEVRWMPPARVGFVMEGTRPLPARTNASETTCCCADAPPTCGSCATTAFSSAPCAHEKHWSPYTPQVVMVPSGLIEVQQSQSSAPATRAPETPECDPQLCGFNRFPVVWEFGEGVLARTTKCSASMEQTLKRSPGGRCRLLPPTWEAAVHDCSPFLASHPVAVLTDSECDELQDEEQAEEKEETEDTIQTATDGDEAVETPETSSTTELATTTRSFDIPAPHEPMPAPGRVCWYPQWYNTVVPYWMPMQPMPLMPTLVTYQPG